MSVKWKKGRPVVEVYDPKIKRKRHVKPADHDMDPAPRGASQRQLERWARQLEQRALDAIDRDRPRREDETCDSFAARWMTDFRAGRGESTRVHNAQMVKAFGRDFAGRTLRSIAREDARKTLNDHPSWIPALKAMFNDALADGLVTENVFSKLGEPKSKGRVDITVLTMDEVELLAAIAARQNPPEFGIDAAALVKWAAGTGCRPGESFAAKYSLLDGDLYHLETQYNSILGRETPPKYGSVGTIYVPDFAQRAVRQKPRRIDDDLMFHGKRGQQLRQESWWRTWDTVRQLFLAELPRGHHLRQRLAVDPTDQFDFAELRHFAGSYMLNVLKLESWVVAKQLRHKDGGELVIKLYGHPERETAIGHIRRAFIGGASVTAIEGGRKDQTA